MFFARFAYLSARKKDNSKNGKDYISDMESKHQHKTSNSLDTRLQRDNKREGNRCTDVMRWNHWTTKRGLQRILKCVQRLFEGGFRRADAGNHNRATIATERIL